MWISSQKLWKTRAPVFKAQLPAISWNSQKETRKYWLAVYQSDNEHLDFNERDINRTHCIGNPRNTDEKPRLIIMKLVRYNDRKKIFDSKKKLKGKKVAITESLTIMRMKKLNKARERYNFKSVWNSDRNILYKDGLGKIKIYYS